MKKKSEVLTHFKEYVAMSKNYLGGRFVELRSDNGGEYTSHDLQQYLKEKGIEWKPSTPRTPEQNGIAERAIRTISTMIRSMLHHAGLGNAFWCYAAMAVAYVYNRLHHSKLPKGKTPYEILKGKKPNISNLKVFGCMAVIAHIDRETRTKKANTKTGQYVRIL